MAINRHIDIDNEALITVPDGIWTHNLGWKHWIMYQMWWSTCWIIYYVARLLILTVVLIIDEYVFRSLLRYILSWTIPWIAVMAKMHFVEKKPRKMFMSYMQFTEMDDWGSTSYLKSVPTWKTCKWFIIANPFLVVLLPLCIFILFPVVEVDTMLPIMQTHEWKHKDTIVMGIAKQIRYFY